MHSSRVIVGTLLGVAALAGCGGGDGENDNDGDSAATDEETVTEPTAGVDGRIFSDAYEPVCRGTGVDVGAPYEPGPGVHPTMLFQGDSPTDITYLTGSDFPDGWVLDFEQLETVELVTCLIKVESTSNQICDGYTSDDSDEESRVETFDEVWDLSIRNATTAEVLATTTIETSGAECPSLVFFDADDPDPKPYSQLVDSAEIELFIKPYVNP